MTADVDQPPPATEKYIADWREGEFKFAGQDSHPWPMGPEGARLHIVIWGDYQEPYSAQADDFVRKFIAGRKDAQYVFRNYPVNQACNPAAGMTKHPLACRAHQAAEAAGIVGGLEGYWKMHEWLMKHQEDFSEETLRKAVQDFGFPTDAFFVAMDSDEVKNNILEDSQYAKALGLFQVPWIYVNGRYIPRWRVPGEHILERIMTEAANQPAQPVVQK
jgi:serine/threonine-protein kinase